MVPYASGNAPDTITDASDFERPGYTWRTQMNGAGTGKLMTSIQKYYRMKDVLGVKDITYSPLDYGA